MVLVDTSVWISHLRGRNSRLQDLLEFEAVFCHPFVIGELACGHIKNRSEILSLLGKIPQAQTVEHPEIMLFIEKHGLAGKGLGLIDMHILASASLSGLSLWTEDKLLAHAARQLRILHE